MMGGWLKLIFFDRVNLAGLCLRLVESSIAELTLCLLFFLELAAIIHHPYYLCSCHFLPTVIDMWRHPLFLPCSLSTLTDTLTSESPAWLELITGQFMPKTHPKRILYFKRLVKRLQTWDFLIGCPEATGGEPVLCQPFIASNFCQLFSPEFRTG